MRILSRTLARDLALVALLGATPAMAQVSGAFPPVPPPSPADDPIGALIDRHGRAPGDEDEPDTAQVRSGVRSPQDVEPTFSAPRPGAPATPFAAPPKPAPGGPVSVDDLAHTPDGPPSVAALAYDARIRSSFASAESFQGPMEGGWTLSAAGRDLYALQLVDRRDRLEGAWRDLRRRGQPNASGFVDELQRQGAQVVLRFPAGSGVTLITLRQGVGGGWVGELTEGGATVQVALRRTGP